MGWNAKRCQGIVLSCRKCQLTKYSTKVPVGLLQPIPPPARVWEDISLDFIIGLPSLAGHTSILVIVDSFSKAARFSMFPSHASKTSELFASIYCRHHGFPQSIISDDDPIFLSGFRKELFH